MTYIYNQDELYHFGIKGQKWGVRNYQNADGTLTEAGKKRYYNSDGSLNKRGLKRQSKRDKAINSYKETISRNRSRNDTINFLKNNYNKRKSYSEIGESVHYNLTDDYMNSGYRSSYSTSSKTYKTKDEATKAYLEELDKELKKNNKEIKTYNGMIKELKNADISADTFLEESKRNNAIGTGILLLGTSAMAAGLGMAVSDDSTASQVIGGMAGIGLGYATAILGMVKSSDETGIATYEKYHGK